MGNAVAIQKAEKSAQAGHRSRRRSAGQTEGVAFGKKPAEIGGRQVFQIPQSGSPAQVFGGEAEESRQIAAIGVERVYGKAPFMRQPSPPVLDGPEHGGLGGIGDHAGFPRHSWTRSSTTLARNAINSVPWPG